MASTARLPITFTTKCSAHRRQFQSAQLFRFRDLTGHTDSINAIEFSDDGTLLISGGKDKTVQLWSLNQDRDEWNSNEMETTHEGAVVCLAFASDTHRIFSGGLDQKILIHDVRS